MPLRRVVLLEGEATMSSFRDDAEQLRVALTSKGVGVVSEGGDGFIALPGAIGELDLLLKHLEGHDLPCGLLNSSGYFSDLLKNTPDPVMDRFVHESQRGRVIMQRDPHDLVQAMVEYLPPETRRSSGE